MSGTSRAAIVVTGYRLFDGIIKEFGAERDREQLKAEILASVRSLTLAEIEQDVDQAMQSSAGQTATSSLSPQQLEVVRRQLLRLPTEVDRLLTEIEIREDEAARLAAAQAHQEREGHGTRAEVRDAGQRHEVHDAVRRGVQG